MKWASERECDICKVSIQTGFGWKKLDFFFLLASKQVMQVVVLFMNLLLFLKWETNYFEYLFVLKKCRLLRMGPVNIIYQISFKMFLSKRWHSSPNDFRQFRCYSPISYILRTLTFWKLKKRKMLHYYQLQIKTNHFWLMLVKFTVLHHYIHYYIDSSRLHYSCHILYFLLHIDYSK